MLCKTALILSWFAGAALISRAASSGVATNLVDELRLLRAQNQLLQQQVDKQGGELDALTQKVQDLESTRNVGEGAAASDSGPAKSGFSLGKVDLSAEGGLAWFNTGSEGFAPHSDFRVDEARLFVEAPVWQEVYFYSDVDLATRENQDTQVALGELYLDAEDVSQLWGQDRQLNLRAGRMEIPFGEEYLNRYAMENPLISHSVADFWGISPGAELYGSLGKFSYVTAVQDGSGVNGVQDFQGDKSVAGRIGYDPNAHWHLSVSAMRTGDLNASQGRISALWFGNGFFRSIGSPATTQFHANLVEGDFTARWPSGHVSGSGGYARYDDNDPGADHGRNLFYYAAEVEQNLPHKFYVAARYSQVFAAEGYPIVGLGNYGEYFYGEPTTQIWRLSLGAGYRFSDQLALKTEYSFEHGTELGGDARDDEDFWGTEAVFKF